MTANVPTPNHEAIDRFGLPAITVAVRAGLLWRIRPDGGEVHLSITPPAHHGVTETLEALLRYLNEPVERFQPDGSRKATPRTYATREQITDAGISSRHLARAIGQGVTNGVLCRGTLSPGRSGRPPVVCWLADQPLPTHVDGLKVRW